MILLPIMILLFILAWKRLKSFKPKMVDGAFEDFSKPPLYNPFGDKSMNRVLLNAKF